MWSLKWYYLGICCNGASLTSSEMLFTFNKRCLLTINFKVCQGQAFLKHSAQPRVSRYQFTYVRISNGFLSFLNPVCLSVPISYQETFKDEVSRGRRPRNNVKCFQELYPAKKYILKNKTSGHCFFKKKQKNKGRILRYRLIKLIIDGQTQNF